MGYSQQHGGGGNGDLLILDQEDIAEADSVKDVYLKRIPASQVNVVLVQGRYRFPFISGELRQPDANSLKPSSSLSEDDINQWAVGKPPQPKMMQLRKPVLQLMKRRLIMKIGRAHV